MTIKRITKINHRIFRNFSWPSNLPDFERYNLIYGWNGSGKTTLSNLFRALEKKVNITDGTAEFEFEDGNIISGANLLGNQTIPMIKVFNRDFIDESVFPKQQATNIAPIFIIGEENVEKQKQIDIHSANKADITKQLSNREIEFAAATRAEEQFAIAAGRTIKTAAGLAGYPPYSNYNQASFRIKAEELSRRDNVDTLILTEEKYEVFRKISVADMKSIINLISYTTPDIAHWASVTEGLLKKSIVATALEEFSGDPKREQWVRQGFELHGADGKTCMFCGQPLPAQRIQKLEEHFNESYKNLIAELHTVRGKLDCEIRSLEVVLPEVSDFYDDLQNAHKQQTNNLNVQKAQMRDQLQNLIRLIDIKTAAPFQIVPIDSMPEALTMVAIDKINAIINRHNERTEEFNQQVTIARKNMEEHLVAQALNAYSENKKAKNTLETTCKVMQENIKFLDKQIQELEQDIVEHQKPAEELSADLAVYLGHKELEIKPLTDGPGYSIFRLGQIAKNLSEGEKTAVAFLYFLKSLEDKDFDLADGVVVIDDPVSSLDANSLYGAFGYLKEKTVKAKQLFILTHHFTLFKQAKNWLGHMPKNDSLKRVAKYQIECECGASCRISKICSLHKLLDEYDSEYYYLFKKVYSIGNNSDPTVSLDQYYGMPNLARRLVEAFFAFKQPNLLKGNSNSSLFKVIEGTNLNTVEKTKIDRFLNIFSHLQNIGEQDHDISILSETPAIMKSVLKMIEAEDPGHFKEMKKVIGVIA